MPWSTRREEYSYQSDHSYGSYFETHYTYTTLYMLNDKQSKLAYIESNINHNEFDIRVRFSNKKDAEIFAESLSKNILFYRDGEFVVMYHKSDVYQKGLFLKALIKQEPSVNEISEQLFEGLGLKELNTLRAKPTNEAINFVIHNEAKNYSRSEWLLLDYLDNKTISVDAILKLISKISPDNPCFTVANNIGLKLAASKAPNPLMEHKSEQQSLSLDTKTINEAERIKNLELRLAFALNGTVKGLADPIFSELCNDSWDTPPLEGVSGNHTFLVNMARRIREERAAAAKLEQHPVNASSKVTSSVSNSSGVNPSSASIPESIRLPEIQGSRLLNLFRGSKPKPILDTSAKKSESPSP